MRCGLVFMLAILASCSPQASTKNGQSFAREASGTSAESQSLPPTSAAALDAKHTAERYFALVRHKKFAEARMLWDHDGADSGGDAAALAASFGRFTSYTPSVGDPTEIKTQGGVQYVAVAAKAKVTEKRTGRIYARQGAVLLRRAVDGTGQGGAWRIWGTDLREKH